MQYAENPPTLEQTLLSLFSETNCIHVGYSDENAARNQCKELRAFLSTHGKTAGFVAGGTPIEGEEGAFRYDAATGTPIPAERAEVYQCAVVFGSAITMAFDFLRDGLSNAPIQTDHDTLLLADADRLLSDAHSMLIISAAESGDFTPDETATAIAAAKEKGVDYLVENAPDGSAAIVLLDKLGSSPARTPPLERDSRSVGNP